MLGVLDVPGASLTTWWSAVALALPTEESGPEELQTL